MKSILTSRVFQVLALFAVTLFAASTGTAGDLTTVSFMFAGATLAVTNPTLLDLKNVMDPDGSIANVVEILNETNEVLDDMTWIEGNLPTGHQTSIRTGIPAATWRKLYGGVQPNKSTVVKITDSCGSLEQYAEIDKALADLNGNSAAWRLSEDRAHIEGMSQELADTLFYGSEATEPEAFTGFAPRFNSLSAANGDNIVSGAGAGADNTSIWLVVWGPNTVHGIYPKGTKAGLEITDKGQVTVEDADGSGGRMEAYRTHYKWNCGVTVRDWRYIVRIANIDSSDLTKDAATGADLVDLMAQALELIPSLGMGRAAFYCNRRVKSFLRRQIRNNIKQSTLSMENIAGKHVLTFDGLPVRRCDAITITEAAVV